MEYFSARTLLDSITRLGVLTSDASTTRPKPVQNYCQNVYDFSGIVTPLVEDLCNSPEEQLNEVLRELDTAINEASGLIGNWHQTTSKIYFVSTNLAEFNILTCHYVFSMLYAIMMLLRKKSILYTFICFLLRKMSFPILARKLVPSSFSVSTNFKVIHIHGFFFLNFLCRFQLSIAKK
jgi:hypothetical protein